MKTRIIDDLIVLGRAVPEPIKSGRVTICLGGYSYTLGFIRVYPTKTAMDWNRWDIVRVEVEKDDRDTRAESWKIVGSSTDWDNLGDKIEVVGSLKAKDRLNLITNLTDDCVNDINDAKRSLGIIKPVIKKRYFDENPSYGRMFQLALPGIGEKTKVKRDFEHEPRLVYRCSICRAKNPHDQQVLEWGFYEWFRKHPGDIDQVWENALLDSPDHELFLLVGNQYRYRTSFLVISILRLHRAPVMQPLIPLRKWTPE